jgi:arylsulfate sulfotransferase
VSHGGGKSTLNSVTIRLLVRLHCLNVWRLRSDKGGEMKMSLDGLPTRAARPAVFVGGPGNPVETRWSLAKPMPNPASRCLAIMTVLAALFVPGANAFAVNIQSGPTLTQATSAPLAGVLQVNTDVDSRVSVLVSDGTSIWEKDFFDFGTNHSETLLGFRPGETNLILVTVFDKFRNAATAPELLTFVTPALPSDFPTSAVLTDQPDLMEPGYTLFIVHNLTVGSHYVTLMDSCGQVVWWSRAPQGADYDVRQLGNGNLFIPQQTPANSFVEINMLGQTVRSWTPPAGFPVDGHDGIPTDHGTILYLTNTNRVVRNFPDSMATNAALVTKTIDDSPIFEISATNGALLHAWSPLDMLDPTRVTYLTYVSPGPKGVDNYHANAILEDASDNSILVSLRNQNAIIKFSRTGQLKWILGPPENWKTNRQGTNLQEYLLHPVGTPFEWNYAEHSLMLTPQRTLLTFDNGNYRANPFAPPVADPTNYSRGVEFSINETNMEVTQVWDSTAAGGDRLFTPIFGKTQWLPQTRDLLVTYGSVSYINGSHPSPYAAAATMARVIEYTHDPVPQVVFDLSFFDYANTNSGYRGYNIYRATRVPDLYAHPANPVTDLCIYPPTPVTGLLVGGQFAAMHLEFSADPAFTYEVQASSDLTHWTTVGSAVPDGGPGDFGFDDLSSSRLTTRFYRVVTH